MDHYKELLLNLTELLWNETEANKNIEYKYADFFLRLDEAGLSDEEVEHLMGKEFCNKAFKEMELLSE